MLEKCRAIRQDVNELCIFDLQKPADSYTDFSKFAPLFPNQRRQEESSRQLRNSTPALPASLLLPITAMRKAGLARNRSRRKGSAAQNGPGTPAAPNEPLGASASGNGAPGPSSTPVERRKPTQEEADLTAKNYRLAKELSELRVRHRDETKTVTRLTMENMNLASRCREALSHVAMMKKELATHQRRAAEALALQRQQSKRSSGPGSEGLVPVPPPPPPPNENLPQAHGTGQSVSSSIEKEMSTSLVDISRRTSSNVSLPSTPRVSELAEKSEVDFVLENSETERTPPRKPSTSWKVGGYMGIVVSDEIFPEEGIDGPRGDSLDFPSNNIQPLPVTPERESVEDNSVSLSHEETARSSFLTPQTSGDDDYDDVGNIDKPENSPESLAFPTPTVLKDGKGLSNINSIDAFEASFNAEFPTSFSVPSVDPPPPLDIAFDVPEFSDPFFLGSLDGGGGSSSSPFLDPNTRSASKGNSESQNDVLKRGREEAKKKKNPPSSRMLVVSKETNKEVTADKILPSDPFPASAMSAFEAQLTESPIKKRSSIDNFFQTPTLDFDSVNVLSPPEILSPSRPEKFGRSEARAQYDAALGGKIENFIGKSDINSSTWLKFDKQHEPQKIKPGREQPNTRTKPAMNHSPSVVLKRLQQRRAREKNYSSTEASLSIVTSEKKLSSDRKLSDLVNEDTFSTTHPPSSESDSNTNQSLALMNGDYGPKVKKNSSNPIAKENHVSLKGHGKRDSSKGRVMTMTKLSDEMRQLDAIAHASSTTSSVAVTASTQILSNSDNLQSSGPLTRRRSVKQPISYSEPALNTKLRSGDIFFPKKELGPEVAENRVVDVAPVWNHSID